MIGNALFPGVACLMALAHLMRGVALTCKDGSTCQNKQSTRGNWLRRFMKDHYMHGYSNEKIPWSVFFRYCPTFYIQAVIKFRSLVKRYFVVNMNTIPILYHIKM